MPQRIPSMQSPKIFISYRREDATGKARQLHENLERHFGEDSTFLDVDMEGGLRYKQMIKNALDSCEVFLAIIGPNWLTIKDKNNVRRLDQEDDWVRFEIEAALKREDILVIPVLVGNAKPPQPDELPKPLESLMGEIQAETLREDHWDSDLTRLIKTIERTLGRSTSGALSAKRPWIKWLITASAVLVVGLVGLILWNVFRDREGTGTATNVNTEPNASPIAKVSVSPIASPEGQTNINQKPTNATTTSSPSEPTPTPTPTPKIHELINTEWIYARNGADVHLIRFIDKKNFNYWDVEELIDKRNRKPFKGTWSSPNGAEIILDWGPDTGIERDIGKIDGYQMRGRGEGKNGKVLYSWRARRRTVD